MQPRVVFFAPPKVTPLDLAGPLQVFRNAGQLCGAPYRIDVCALTRSVPVEGNLNFSNLFLYNEVVVGPGDILIVSGFSSDAYPPRFFRLHRPLFKWIRDARAAGATVCSVCTGSFILAEAGILDGLSCATHFTEAGFLQKRYPKTTVKEGVLFVEEGNVLTSAGIASGIDLALHLVGKRHGQKLAFDVARYMVVYLRRSGEFEQESVYLKHRNHLGDVVHRAQSLVIENLDSPPSLGRLAERVGASPRNLSRRFRRSLGLSVGEYVRDLRLERAHSLLQEPGSKVEQVAKACGFSASRQLRNLYHARFGRSPREIGRAANDR